MIPFEVRSNGVITCINLAKITYIEPENTGCRIFFDSQLQLYSDVDYHHLMILIEQELRKHHGK